MTSIVIFASHSDNTRKVADAIANGLQTRGTVKVFQVDSAPALIPPGTDLLVVGGPTEVHGTTQPRVRFFDRMQTDGLSGIAAAAFDTRLRWLAGCPARQALALPHACVILAHACSSPRRVSLPKDRQATKRARRLNW
jgi:menaquinone-dependent protoporphyrinogen IX oxidase